jgi:hypothetical protein
MSSDEEKQEVTTKLIELVRKEIANKEEVKSINGKVLAFGIIAVALVIACICGALMMMLFSANSRYVENANEVVECKSTMVAMQYELAEKKGRLDVYDEYLNDRRRDIIKKTIADYMKKENIKTTDVTLEEFKNWVFGIPNPSGVGGPAPVQRPFSGGSSH